MEREKIQLNVRINKDLYVLLKRYCKTSPRTYKMNYIISLAIRDYIKASNFLQKNDSKI